MIILKQHTIILPNGISVEAAIHTGPDVFEDCGCIYDVVAYSWQDNSDYFNFDDTPAETYSDALTIFEEFIGRDEKDLVEFAFRRQ